VVGQRLKLYLAFRAESADPSCEFCQESDMAQCKTDSRSQINSTMGLGQGYFLMTYF